MVDREGEPGGAAAGSRAPVLTAAALLASYGALMAMTCGHLPERVATHFAASGEPNGWMTRGGFVLFQAGMVAVLGAVFFALPRLLAKVPTKYINVPNRDYWTRPENLPALRSILVRYMGWMGVLVVGLMAGLFAITLRVNLSPRPHLEPAWAGIVLGLFVAADLAWVVLFITRFTRIRDGGQRSMDEAPKGR
jgi:uncharacterized membrane protein